MLIHLSQQNVSSRAKKNDPKGEGDGSQGCYETKKSTQTGDSWARIYVSIVEIVFRGLSLCDLRWRRGG